MLQLATAALLAAALVSAPPDADAKGKGRSSSASSNNSNASNSERSKGTTVILRSGGSSSATGASSSLASDFVPIQPGADPGLPGQGTGLTPSEQAEADRAQARLAAKERAAAEKLEAERLAAERLADRMAAERAAARAAAERAQEQRQAALQEQKTRNEAAVAADVDRVLKRALSDYPVLGTPEGSALLQQILARQKVLAGQGVYPSVAMVEAVADHAQVLNPRPRQQVQAQAAPSPAAPSFGGCRWISSAEWSCK